MATIMGRARWLWRRGADGRQPADPSPGPGSADGIEALTARIEHLEAALEGLQDAVYRQAVVYDESITELRRRTDPQQLAQDLSRHARRHGL
jgi:hypothetical protein